jgi:hypothetical protein
MSISRANFDQISETDLQGLVDTGVPEGILVEYKICSYGRADSDVKEFLKDASSFANTPGGHLIIGMDEVESVPTRIVPLVGLDADKEKQRLENLLRDGITPRIAGIHIRAVPVSGGSVLVLRIPRSWNAPHQVSARNTNRFYVRNSAGVHEMSIDELRASFSLGVGAQERARAFRTERLGLITSRRGPAVLSNPDGKLVLHISPLTALVGPLTIDLQLAYNMGPQLQPMGTLVPYEATLLTFCVELHRPLKSHQIIVGTITASVICSAAAVAARPALVR